MTSLAEGFVPHNGDPCPVQENVTVYAMLRCGLMGWAMRHASAWEWRWEEYKPTDIIAYRP